MDELLSLPKRFMPTAAKISLPGISKHFTLFIALTTYNMQDERVTTALYDWLAAKITNRRLK